MEDIRTLLKHDRLIFDGGMGTYFASKYRTMLEHCENVNTTDFMKIYDIHREYIEAGSHAIKTNTFAANINSFGGNEEELRAVIEAGWKTAVLAAEGCDVYVFADIGQINTTDEESVADKYILNSGFFLELGAENFIFETLSNFNGIAETAKYIKSVRPSAFIIASFAIFPDGHTKEGEIGEELLKEADRCEYIDAIGLNCVSGPHHVYNYFKGLNKFNKPFSVMPNSGYPTVINNRTYFESSPDYFAMKMRDIADCGAAILGGCCGTTPEYIRKTIEALSEDVEVSEDETDSDIEVDEKTSYVPEFDVKLSDGKKVIAVELDPPETADISKFMKNAALLKNAGIDIMTIADCPIARARVDSSLLACKLKRELNIDVMPHMTCRDRNINATKALLLGLNIENIRNVLVITGDPIPSAQRDEVKSVFNFNSRMLAKYVRTLNETVFSDSFHIFGALNINAKNFDVQLKMAKEKEQNGMEGFLTQPVLTPTGFENLKLAKKELNGKILAGIIPVMNYRNACFMDSEISGIKVDERIKNMFKGLDKTQSVELGIKISVEIANRVKDFTDGYYFMTPFSRADVICRIIEQIEK